jgi:hypothetical protein
MTPCEIPIERIKNKHTPEEMINFSNRLTIKVIKHEKIKKIIE